MGFELWYSKHTGIRRKGTTFSELQDIFINNITTKFIYESLACCRIYDNSFEVKRTLNACDFDVIGVIDNNDKKIGYIERAKIGDNEISSYLTTFSLNQIIAESTPISELFEILTDREFVFVLKKNEIDGIVTRADINKPIVRIYLFGIISLYEFHLNFWINKYHKNESWKKILKDERLNTADKLFQIRKGNNVQLTLLECLQFCDKRDILRNTERFIEKFEYQSKPKFKRLLKNIEKIRNELAHSQNSIISNLKWAVFVDSIKQIKYFLEKSENVIGQ